MGHCTPIPEGYFVHSLRTVFTLYNPEQEIQKKMMEAVGSGFGAHLQQKGAGPSLRSSLFWKDRLSGAGCMIEGRKSHD